MTQASILMRNTQQSEDFTLPGAVRNYAPDLKLEPLHTELHLELDLEQQSARGYALITLQANVAGANTIKLDAVDFEDLAVQETAGHTIDFSYDDQQLRISFAQEIPAGETRVIRIDYQVQEPISGIKFSKPDARRPELPLFAITDNETERARYWFPCIDFPTVRSKMEYYLSAPEDFTILANGALISETETAGVKTAHWKLDYPCPSYLACFAIGEFSSYEDEPLDGMPIAYFADKSYTSEQLKRTFGATRSMLVWIQQKLGKAFPYPKYFQVAGREVGGAMENISLVTWDDKFMLDENMAREWQYIMDLINVHELSHSYFGDSLVSYDFAHVWLKESWATYIESVWLEDSAGLDAMHWQLAEEARSYMTEVRERYVRPIITREYDHSWNMFDMHLYPGGAWRLHMLRQLVGDAAFWAGVQDYVNTYAAQTVKSIDFQRSIEKHSGINLDGFFDMWFHSKGYPVLKVNFSYEKTAQLGKFTIEQTQQDQEKGIGLFDFPLEIAWQDQQGTDHLEVVQVNKQLHVFQIKMTEPIQIALDPAMKALFEAQFNPGDEKLRHLLEYGGTVRSLMQALTELAKTGRRKNLQAIRDYLRQETRWGLRIHAYRSLGEVGNSYAYEHLAALLASETDPMVMEEAAKACGRHRHSILRTAILEQLQAKNLPYRGQMALLESLGKQRYAEDIPLLAEYAQASGWRNLNRAGAYLGLAATRQEAAVVPLLADLSKPVHFYDEKIARLGAIAGIIDWLPAHLRKQAGAALCEAVEDPSYFVKVHAARSLGKAKLTEGLCALDSLFSQLPIQDHPLIKRQLQAIRSHGVASESKQLQQQLDKLVEQIAGMEQRLQELETDPD